MKQRNYITVLIIITVLLNVIATMQRGYWSIGGECFIWLIPVCLKLESEYDNG